MSLPMPQVWWTRPGQNPQPAILDKLRAAARPLYLAAGYPLLRQTLRAMAGAAGARDSTVFSRYMERTFAAGYREWRRISAAEQRMILAHLLRTLDLPRIRPIAERPGVLKAAQRVIRELKETGQPPERWTDLLTQGKEPDFAALAVAYQQHLEAHRLADKEDTWRMAAAHLARGVEHDLVVVEGFATVTGIERQVFAALAQHAAVILVVTYDPDRPELCAPTVQDLGPWWQTARPAPVQAAPASHTVRLIKAPAPETEVREIARTVKGLLQKGPYLPEDIAVVTADPENYRELVRETFAQYGIPVELPPEPLAAAPVVQAVLGLLRLVEGSWAPAELLNLMKSPYLGCQPEAAHWLEQAAAALPPAGSPQEWLAVIQTCPTSPQDSALQEAAAAYIEELAASAGPLQSAAPVEQHCATLARLLRQRRVEERILALTRARGLDGTTAALAARELAAFRLLIRVLVQLEGLYKEFAQTPAITPGLFLTLINGELAEASYPAQRITRGSAVRFMVPPQTEGLRAPVVFIAGLAEGVFPAHRTPDWVIPERRRQAIRAELPLTGWDRHQAVERLQFLRAVRMATESLWLSYSSTGPDGGARLPSAFFAEAGEQPCTTVSLSEATPTTFSRVMSREELLQRAARVLWAGAGSDAERTLAGELTAQVWSPAEQQDVAGRVAAEQARASDQYSPWDGRLADPDALAQLGARFGTARRYSASELEVYAACPFRFLGERVLRLTEAGEYDPDLSPLEQGSGLHLILSRFYTRLGRQPLDAQAEALLAAITEEVVDELYARLAPGLRAARLRQLTRQTRTWLQVERATQERTGGLYTPAYLEWPFGRGTGQPLVLQSASGQEYRLTGVIDRIDTDGDGNFIVYDYKTGGSPPAAHLLDKRLRLQVPLYLTAVRQLAPAGATRPAGGAYYSLKDFARSGGLWRESIKEVPRLTTRSKAVMADEPFEAALSEIGLHVTGLVERLSGGDLTVNPQTECPDFCAMRAACRFDADRLAAKQGRGGEEGQE